MSQEETKSQDSFSRKDAIIIIRVVQGILFGLFTLGIATMFGDASYAIVMPYNISPLGLTITMYGIIGMIACEFLAWRLGKSE